MSDDRETSLDGYVGHGRTKHKPRRCDGCEKWKVKVGAGDFICRHMNPNYKEPSGDYKRRDDCRSWASWKGITKDFWCKHNKWRLAAYKDNGQWP